MLDTRLNDIELAVSDLKSSVARITWQNAYHEKCSALPKFLEKYGDQYADLDFVSEYACQGYYSVQKPISFEQKYAQNTRDYLLEDNWLPLRFYSDPDGRTHYEKNPTIIAQAALAAFNAYLSGWEDSSRLRKLADLLLSMMNKQGALPYEFSWWYYITQRNFAPGWLSGMAQGQAISAFVRGYTLFDDERYIRAAILVAGLMLTDCNKGGTRGDLSDVHPAFFGLQSIEEYVVKPCSVTLNGWLYAILGLVDLCAVCKPEQHAFLHRQLSLQLQSLSCCLPLFDLDGLSTYDLGYITHKSKVNFNLGYHQTHVLQLTALNQLLPDPVFEKYALRWQQFLDGKI